MQRVLVAVDVDTESAGEAVAIVQQLMRKVEWPNEIDCVEVGEAEVMTEEEEV